MSDPHIHEWMNLLVRWIHFIVGVAWIGASFYFNWLENHLNRELPQEPGIGGHLWAVHGGGFYQVRKFRTGPQQLPPTLHWFKWEAYATWLSGMTLLVIVYYWNANLYLIDPEVRELATAPAIALSLGVILGSWFVYDRLCRSLAAHRWLLVGILAAYLVLLSYLLTAVFSARAAYIHVGAVLGTMMVGNVFFVIIPGQKKMVQALAAGDRADRVPRSDGATRSMHNNYFTLPVLFIMLSSHFPSTYGHGLNWLVLAVICTAGVVARHYFNRRQRAGAWWLLLAAFGMLVLTMWLTAPTTRPQTTSGVSEAQVMTMVQARCTVCHSAQPTQAGFATAPAGLVLDTVAQLGRHREQVHQAAVATHTMPPANLTGMTAEERQWLGQWVADYRGP